MAAGMRIGALSSNRILQVFALAFCITLTTAYASSPAPAIACPSCDDTNKCTVDTCDTTTGTCRHDPLSCDDGNPCTIDSCVSPTDPFLPACRHVPVAANAVCDDGNSCTVADACDGSGHCIGQVQAAGAACDDANACTSDDRCDDAQVCRGLASAPGSACDDGSLCTSGDICVTGASGAIVYQGAAKDCSDGSLCTVDACDPATGQCSSRPADCNDGNPCTADSCDEATGSCVRTNVSGACEDGNFCTVNDACVAGNCLGSPRDCGPVQCGSNFCDPYERRCKWNPGGAACPPGGQCYSYQCDTGGVCRIFTFSGTSCSTGNPCSVDMCVRGTCTPQISRTGQACDDNNLCTVSDVCAGFQCRGTPKCSDGSVCTTDVCDPATGACLGSQPVSCDDHVVCTTDTCDAVLGCQHSIATCDDHNVCTTDYCDPVLGCRNVDSGTCDDQDPCTLDSCEPASGCSHALQASEACPQTVVGFAVSRESALGKGSGTVFWSTTHEIDVAGFNVILYDAHGTRIQLNRGLILCKECGTGQGIPYSFIIAKHKGGQNLFLELVHADGRIEVFGPAVKQ